MIERFTKEELEIIRKEIAELPKDYGKRHLCEEPLRKVYARMVQQDQFNGVYSHEITDHILAVADYTLCNYSKSPKDRRKYQRNTFVPNELGDEYMAFVTELSNLVLEYFRKAPVREMGKSDETNA